MWNKNWHDFKIEGQLREVAEQVSLYRESTTYNAFLLDKNILVPGEVVVTLGYDEFGYCEVLTQFGFRLINEEEFYSKTVEVK